MTKVKLSQHTLEKTRQLCREHQLPDSFHSMIDDIYARTAELICLKKKSAPLLININGAQGTGKTTFTEFVKVILENQYHYSTAILSIDDFYLTLEQRQKISATIHPLLKTRGVPGTHDYLLIQKTLEKLLSGQSCQVPRFNKAIDDRAPESDWIKYHQPVDVILFEGWCNHSPVQNEQQLSDPINELERNEDKNGIWRHFANHQLQIYHQSFFHLSDCVIMLQASDFENIFSWRQLQEKKLKQSTLENSQTKIMNDQQLLRFIQHYERITRHTLQYLPQQSDILLAVDNNHMIKDIIVHG
jgi:D-glycerate 3-kinase